MTWPSPQAGLVVAFSYLWHREAIVGQEEGRKGHPYTVVGGWVGGRRGNSLCVADHALIAAFFRC